MSNQPKPDWYMDPDFKPDQTHGSFGVTPGSPLAVGSGQTGKTLTVHCIVPQVVCLDCPWEGLISELKAQACPVCDGRVADC